MKEKVFDLIKGNLKNPKFYVLLLVLAFVFILLFPYIDANFFYYNRVEKRVSILKEISEIDPKTLIDKPVLEAEYESILSEISKQKDGSIGNIFITNSSQAVKNTKFFTGAAFPWLIAVACFFIKFNRRWHKLIGFILFASIGIGLGFAAEAMPTVIDPMCNYVLVPTLEVALLGLLATSSRTAKARVKKEPSVRQ